MERRLAAILAADVVGYGPPMGADEAGTLAALQALRAEVIDPEIAKQSGRIVKLLGDGTLVEFASVVAAVECAEAIQRAMATREAARDSEPRRAAGEAADAIGARAGEPVQVIPDDYAKVPVKGELVASSIRHLTVRRRDPQVGDVVAHFPQVGFVVLPDA